MGESHDSQSLGRRVNELVLLWAKEGLIAEEEADRLAEAAVLGSAKVVRRLVGLHRQSWLGWSERVGQRLSGGAGRHLPLLLTLSAAAPALGLLAAALEVRSAAAAFAGGIPEVAVQVALVEGIGSAGALLLAGLLAGLAGALSWFVLLNRDAVRARREVDAILDDPGQGRSRVRRSSDHRPDAFLISAVSWLALKAWRERTPAAPGSSR